jgi:dephospho-CoA kinase
MGKWSGKTVIGLTGNIGSGKSVVRKMLEQLGAYGIDADALAHRAMLPGAPGFDPVLKKFGSWILSEDGTINRARLGSIVFNDPFAMKELEQIVHPLVKEAVDILVKNATQPVIVIEAIKLIESGMAAECNSIWVTEVTPDVQIKRLITKRGMRVSEARMRIKAQPPQADKVNASDVVINNSGSFTETFQQVVNAWKKTVPPEVQGTRFLPTLSARKTSENELLVIRAKPAYASLIAEMYNRFKVNAQPATTEMVMSEFSEKAFLLLMSEQKVAGFLAWKVENLVACTTDIGLDSTISTAQAMEALVSEMEKASRDLQCEVSLINPSGLLAENHRLWENLGYQRRSPGSLAFSAWKEAALECSGTDGRVLFKQLRLDQVLRPI